MIDRESFEAAAHSYRIRLVLWLLSSICVWVPTSLIAMWAGQYPAWEAKVIVFIFWILAGIALMGTGFFACELYEWRKWYPAAQAALDNYDDWDSFRSLYRKVIGPIPWI